MDVSQVGNMYIADILQSIGTAATNIDSNYIDTLAYRHTG